MSRRCPPYSVTNSDLKLIAAAGRTMQEAVLLTGLSRDCIRLRIRKFGIKLKSDPHRRGRPTTEAHVVVVDLRRQGFSYRTIAERAEISLSSVKNHLGYARRKGEIHARQSAP